MSPGVFYDVAHKTGAHLAAGNAEALPDIHKRGTGLHK